MALNGNLVGFAVKGVLALLIGVSGWMVTKVERHESRITATEMVGARLETKVDQLIKNSDEMKGDLKRLIQGHRP